VTEKVCTDSRRVTRSSGYRRTVRSLVFLLAVCGVASAQPAAEFQKELQAGIDAFRLGKYDEARMRLQAARTIDRKAGDPHRYLAAVAQAMKEWGDCIASAREALIVEPRAKDVEDTRKLHEVCRVGAGLPRRSRSRRTSIRRP
jgi:hypothetical protein